MRALPLQADVALTRSPPTRFRCRKEHMPLLARLLRLPGRVRCPVTGCVADRVTALAYLLKRYAYPNRVTSDLPCVTAWQCLPDSTVLRPYRPSALA